MRQMRVSVFSSILLWGLWSFRSNERCSSGGVTNQLLHAWVCFSNICGLPVCVCVSVKFSPSLPIRRSSLAAHADVAGLAAGILLGVYRGQAHQLVAADLRHRAQRQVYGLRVDHLQDNVLGVVKHQTPVFVLLAGQKTVVADVERRKPLLAEVVAPGALGGQDHDDVVVGRVHAVEVSKVQTGVGVEEHVGLDLKAVATVWGVLRRLACVELCVAAEEDALQFATNGGAMTAAVVFH